jgi:hypothetical protein
LQDVVGAAVAAAALPSMQAKVAIKAARRFLFVLILRRQESRYRMDRNAATS